MKKEIGPHDAIDVEAASAAYVENFGLKIFAAADNEDRRGAATRCDAVRSAQEHLSDHMLLRSTAKKFLAASNFLEVLRVFPKIEIPDSVIFLPSYTFAGTDIRSRLRRRSNMRNGKRWISPRPSRKAVNQRRGLQVHLQKMNRC